jgi:hypothetical protein
VIREEMIIIIFGIIIKTYNFFKNVTHAHICLDYKQFKKVATGKPSFGHTAPRRLDPTV